MSPFFKAGGKNSRIHPCAFLTFLVALLPSSALISSHLLLVETNSGSMAPLYEKWLLFGDGRCFIAIIMEGPFNLKPQINPVWIRLVSKTITEKQ